MTTAHYFLLAGEIESSLFYLTLTLYQAELFTVLQLVEYYYSSFTISDSAYGSAFYLSTGFHGLHVQVGIVLLLVSHWRILGGYLTPISHFGFEAAIWYWHFVDVV